MRSAGRLLVLAVLIVNCAFLSGQASAPTKPSTVLLYKNIWRITKAQSQPFHGSIYIFMSNGTLLETSCGEPYRVALWARDSDDPRTLRITEDQNVVATWKIMELTPATLRLEKKLTRSAEKEDVTLTAVTKEFVCPDLPK
jgi:hypothetical protein